MVIEDLTIAVPEADLEDLRDRLLRTRWPGDFGNEHWQFGVSEPYLRELVDHWLGDYDWRVHEAAMNRHRHIRTVIDGVPVHAVVEKGDGPSPTPIVLTHGWPWTFWDHRHVIDALAHPSDPADAFDVIVPSLPGSVFSSPLQTTGVGFTRTAELWDVLMTRLGYGRYAVAGGDVGAYVSAHLAHARADRILGCYLQFPALLSLDFQSLTEDDFGPAEEDWFERCLFGRQTAMAHMPAHIAGPQTLSYAMADSPAGQAAWMLERRRAWSDCDGDVEQRFSKDDLITSFALYWLTNTFATSVRYYAESFRAPWTPVHDLSPTLQAPVGMAVFPKELALVPRHVAERHANLVHYTVMPRGGHFAPAEEPQLYVEDLRDFARALR